MPVSPGIYVNEFDFSTYSRKLGITHLAIVGAASKGPINTPITVTNEAQLVRWFGKPLTTEYGLQSAIQFLKKGDQLTFVRIHNSAVTASFSLPGLSGATAATYATGTLTFSGGANPSDGDTVTLPKTGGGSVVFEFDNNTAYTAGNVPVLIGSSALETLANLVAAVGASTAAVTAVNSSSTVPQATLRSSVAGVAGNVAITESSAAIAVTGLTGGVDGALGSTAAVLAVSAASPGTWGNRIRVRVVAPTSMINDASVTDSRFDLYVDYLLEDGSGYQNVEVFRNMSLVSTSSRYITTVLTDGLTGEYAPSEYIRAEVLPSAASLVSGSYMIGSTPGVPGTDGVTGLLPSHYVGSSAGVTPTGLQALRNPETTEFNLLAIPGVSDSTVIQAGLDLCSRRGDALYLIDPPRGLTAAQVTDWHNGKLISVTGAPTGPLNSTYGALYWAWVEASDAYNNVKLWLPPSGFVAACMATVDKASGPWMTVAGSVRGVIENGLRVEYSPWQDDRDLLNGDPNRVNPIVSFVNGGLTIFGNRTISRRSSALNNVHTRRMLLHAEKVCATAVRVLHFDPNDSHTWIRFTKLVNAELETIKAGRGIEDFRVICDETTNPPEQRQRKTMRGKILIKPAEAAEIILLDFSLLATGASFDESGV